MLCTFGSNGITSADSGGPLMAFINGRWFLEGIANAEMEFLNQKPEIHFLSESLFTKTSSYCAWIEEETKNEALCQRHNFMINNYGK
uniref:Peptidase S1 domain-containing protein n=1 Tax=Panagrolaimus superbus TaxID=310955 RepID=A0A914YEU5_9BILA